MKPVDSVRRYPVGEATIPVGRGLVAPLKAGRWSNLKVHLGLGVALPREPPVGEVRVTASDLLFSVRAVLQVSALSDPSIAWTRQ